MLKSYVTDGTLLRIDVSRLPYHDISGTLFGRIVDFDDQFIKLNPYHVLTYLGVSGVDPRSGLVFVNNEDLEATLELLSEDEDGRSSQELIIGRSLIRGINRYEFPDQEK